MKFDSSIQNNQLPVSKRDAAAMRKVWGLKYISEAKRRVKKAKKFMVNTCPQSRFLELMGRNLIDDGFDYMVLECPVQSGDAMMNCAATIYELRNKVAALELELGKQK
jgi:hypothetical protein